MTMDSNYFLENVMMADNLIDIPNAPPIAGLGFRRFRGAEDFPKMLPVFVASTEVDKIEVAKTLEDLTNDYAPECIGVCRPWRKQGVARALIARSLQAQKTEGMTESALGVDSENPSGAHYLYEQCGFQVVKRNTVFSKPF
jgi:GNAT superfamily N-acetyltransferase